ncbi:MAG: TonB-dependent receptor, partial [Acidobacteriaceae bacterium]|nr:TonB-dependent receptor [Acidobacteriaceae bacterium]
MIPRSLALVFCIAYCAAASEHRGQVTFGGVPVPGATVTISQGGQHFAAVTDPNGDYRFTDLSDGEWNIEVRMLCFEAIIGKVTIAPGQPPSKWELKLLPLDQVGAVTQSTASAAATPPPAPAASQPGQPDATKQAARATPATVFPEDLSQRANDGFLINGSSNNAAASPFSQSAVFGNNRNASKSLYNGSLGMIVDNSIWDAKSFSLTGQDTPKPTYNHLTAVATLGGPLKIPKLMPHGPNFFVGYQWTRERNDNTETGLMPTLAQRQGIVGVGYPGGIVAPSRISPQALALLSLYPLPNFNSSTYNYQIPVVGATHLDSMQSRLNKAFGRRDYVFGGLAFQDTRSDSSNLFGFVDSTDSLGLSSNATWSHRFGNRSFMNLGYQFSRFATHVKPYFDNRENVSGLAGIEGNNQEPQNWGPPSLTFSSGITGISDALPAFNRNQTSGVSDAFLWNRARHNVTVGADFRRQEFNYLSQQNPRGSFTFTGAASGDAFADFLQGIPDASSIAYGNADKYFRESVYDAYAVDDWRITPEFTLNAGLRWEYGAPITELYGRLVDLDIAPEFTQVAPVVASNPVGPLTGRHYPSSLLRSDKNGFEPRVAISWRPLSGSSMVVRAGFGTYRDTSVYQTIASQMAQQAPLSKSLSVQNSPLDPLTLANGFNASPTTTQDTFAVDPNFRVGYVDIWQLSIQRDLPWSMQMNASYLGDKGTRGVQEFLPNTYPAGAANPCGACPVGFAYLTSSGNSTRHAAQIQLRRRLHNGLTAAAQYTFSKAIDDDSQLGSPSRNLSNSSQSSFNPPTPTSASTAQGNLTIAQNWLNLAAERGLSTFDQRHLLTAKLQYTTGMGTGGGTLLEGWRGALFKEWTVQMQITAGSGFPETPI